MTLPDAERGDKVAMLWGEIKPALRIALAVAEAGPRTRQDIRALRRGAEALLATAGRLAGELERVAEAAQPDHIPGTRGWRHD